jgi:hypothetical protein
MHAETRNEQKNIGETLKSQKNSMFVYCFMINTQHKQYKTSVLVILEEDRR